MHQGMGGIMQNYAKCKKMLCVNCILKIVSCLTEKNTYIYFGSFIRLRRTASL